jgi:PAS domain S-box-containing protein
MAVHDPSDTLRRGDTHAAGDTLRRVGRDGQSADPGAGELTLTLLEAVLHTAPVGLGLIGPDHCFVRVNEELAAMNRLPVEDHLGRHVTDVLGARGEAIIAILDKALKHGEPTVDRQTENDGRHFNVSYYPVREHPGAQPSGVGVVVRDVTDQHLAADALNVQARHLGAVAQLGQRALIIDEFDALLAEGVALLVDHLDADLAYVLQHDADAAEFVLRLAHGWEAEDGRRLPDDASIQPGYALHNRIPVTVADTANEERFAVNPLLLEQHAASGLSVVIRGPGKPFGVVGLGSCTPRVFSAEEVDFAQSVANVLGTIAARSRNDAALRTERLRLRLALDAGGMGDWEWDIASNAVSWSPTQEQLFGLEPGTYDGSFEQYVSIIHPEDRERMVETITAAAEGVHPSFTTEHRIVVGGGMVRWIGCSGLVRRDDRGNAIAMIGVSSDITARVESEAKQALLFAGEQEARAEAEAARDRLEFLAEASELLASSLDYRTTLSRVAHLAVSRLADWCSVDVVEDDGAEPTTVVVAHVDPAKVEMATELRRKYPPDAESERGVAAVVRSGAPLMMPVITDDMLAGAAIDDEHLSMLRSLGLNSSMVVPLIVQGRTIGAITLIAAESGRIYNEDDLALASDLARRAAVSIENARLYRARSQVAEALQRSLLPISRPEIPGLDVAVRYRPAGPGSEIGGDFYDVFEVGDGSWMTVIGDVCGKGTEAAAVTGLARDTIRGLSIRERSPRRVLRTLNEVLVRREDESRFLTVAAARLDLSGEGGVRMQLALAGHPLPVVVRADGTVEEVGTPALLLGLFPEVEPVDEPIDLHPGDAVVFYTDGVVEAHGADGQFGDQRLHAVLAACGPSDAEALAQSVVDAVGEFQPGPAQDDLALVVVRVPA